MADQDSFKIGKREQARRQKRKKRLIVLLICAAAVVFVVLCVIFASYVSNRSGTDQIEITDAEDTDEAEDEEADTAADTNSDDADEDESEPAEEDASDSSDEETSEDADADSDSSDESDTAEDADSSDSSDTGSSSSSASTGSGSSSSSASTSSGSSSSSASTSTSSSSSGTSSDSDSSLSASSGTSASTADSTDSTSDASSESSSAAAAETLKSATLTSPVDSVTVGASGTLSCTVTGSTGNDLTADSTIVYYGTGCTITGNQVSFDTVGTAKIYAEITYNGASIRTNTITITVSRAAIESVTLTCSTSEAVEGDTAELTLTVLNTNGEDITADCTVSWTAENCTIEDGIVTLDTVGTARIHADVTYYNATVVSKTVKITVTEDPVVLTSAVVEVPVSEAEKGDSVTLSASALDQDGNVLDDAELSYEGTNCTIDGDTVTFTEGGIAVITVTAVRKGITVTSDPVEITVHNTVTITDEDGTETAIDLTELNQEVSSSYYGWSVSLPEVLSADASNTRKTVTYASDALGFSITFSVKNRSSSDTDSIRTLYQARLSELKDLIAETEETNETLDEAEQTDVPVIRSSSYSRTEGTWSILWQQGDVITAEHYYVGDSRILSVTAVWDESDFPEGESLLSYIMATFQPGDLD